MTDATREQVRQYNIVQAAENHAYLNAVDDDEAKSMKEGFQAGYDQGYEEGKNDGWNDAIDKAIETIRSNGYMVFTRQEDSFGILEELEALKTDIKKL